MENFLTVAGVTSILVFVITLVLQYFPKLRVKWAELASNVKMLLILGAYIVIGAVVAFGGCVALLAGLIPQLQCVDAPTFVQYAFAVMVAIGAGQGVFSLLPELKDVEGAKIERSY